MVLRSVEVPRDPFRLRGVRSLPFFAVIAASAFLPVPWREIVMVAAAAAAYFLTPSGYHRHNEFSFAPIVEVGVLFAGIFLTMVPALELLRHHAPSLGITRPWHFYWLTGGLSAVLDNAPTYLVFLSIAQGLGLGGGIIGVPAKLLAAVSAGAVMMGANTYIGNGPNFMIKAIAEHRGIRMPSFFGFILMAMAALLPLYIAITLIFFR